MNVSAWITTGLLLGGVVSSWVNETRALERHDRVAFRVSAEKEESASPRGEYSGTYVFLQQTVTVAEMPVLADVVATTRAVSIQRLVQEGERLRGSGALCSLDLESTSSLVKMELPAAFRRSLPPVRIDAALTPKNGGWIFRQAPQTLVVGARLAAGESLPTKPEDPRVVDQDGDGKPGVTVRVSGLVSGEIYLVQRSTSRLTGALRGAAFTGRIDFTNEQRVLDASLGVLKDGPEAKPDPGRSYFRLEKVADGTDCAGARRLAGSWR